MPAPITYTYNKIAKATDLAAETAARIQQDGILNTKINDKVKMYDAPESVTLKGKTIPHMTNVDILNIYNEFTAPNASIISYGHNYYPVLSVLSDNSIVTVTVLYDQYMLIQYQTSTGTFALASAVVVDSGFELNQTTGIAESTYDVKTTGDLILPNANSIKNPNGDTLALPYLTVAPIADNTDGVKIVILNAEPVTKYEGYIYFITEEE